MNYITITNPNNIEIKYRLAGIGSRIAAAIIDTFFQVAVMFIAIIIPAAIFISRDKNIDLHVIGLFSSLLIIIFFVIYFLYYIIFEYLSNGKTPGKKLLGLQTITETGAPITLSQAAIRSFFKSTIDMLGVGLAMIFFSKKNKRLGDFAASTVVISLGSRKKIAYLSFPERPLVSAIDVKFTDTEYEVIKEYLANKAFYTDGGNQVFNEITTHLSKKYSLPEDFLNDETLFAACANAHKGMTKNL